MREFEIIQENSTQRFVGFDQLQEQAILSIYSPKSNPNSSEKFRNRRIIWLTTLNFVDVVSLLKLKDETTNSDVIVTNIPNLSLLGLTVSSFPGSSIFLRLDEFTSAILASESASSVVEDMINQISTLDEFFNYSSLTKSQMDLLILISEGHTNIEISRLMFLTEKGVESAIKRLAVRLGCGGAFHKHQNLRILLGRRYAELLGVLS